jgi:signal transduction histidine kinase
VGGGSVIFSRDKKLLQRLDAMLDEAIGGTFRAKSFDESMLSKIESKMAELLDRTKSGREQVEIDRERLRSLIGDISHQTKTPLANITLYGHLLAEQDLTEEQRALADQITWNTEKLDFLIQSLVKISRLENGVIKIELKPGDVREPASAAVRECESLASAKNIELTHPDSGAPVMARFDPRWCREALFNIVENAVKYTPERGRVAISVTEYEMFARIDVADTGRGIPEADFPNVFKRFWRAPESSETRGAGVGLYLAREIITACEGYIKVSSKVGEGSVFSVFLSKV